MQTHSTQFSYTLFSSRHLTMCWTLFHSGIQYQYLKWSHLDTTIPTHKYGQRSEYCQVHETDSNNNQHKKNWLPHLRYPNPTETYKLAKRTAGKCITPTRNCDITSYHIRLKKETCFVFIPHCKQTFYAMRKYITKKILTWLTLDKGTVKNIFCFHKKVQQWRIMVTLHDTTTLPHG